MNKLQLTWILILNKIFLYNIEGEVDGFLRQEYIWKFLGWNLKV